MGQIVTTINEAGVNGLFVEVFNALPDQHFSISQQAAAGPLQIQLGASNTLRTTDLATTASVIDLRGDSLTPPVRYANQPLQLLAQLQATVTLGGLDPQRGPARHHRRAAGRPGAGVGGTPAPGLGGPAGLRRRRDAHRLRRQPQCLHRGRAQHRRAHRYPALAGQVFDALQPQVSATATELARAITAQTRVLLGPEVPARYSVQSPGGGTVQMQVTQLAVAIGASQASLTATFA